MRRFFSIHMHGMQFLMNVLLFSLAGLVPVLLIYVLLSPGFASTLIAGGPPLSRFLRQVLTNGLPVVFVTNYVGFFLYALSQEIPTSNRDPALYLLADPPTRVAIFLILHALIYMLSADWFGSFGGSRITALGVVAPTLARSALFENISGVYLYATMVSAIPLYVSAIAHSPRLSRTVAIFPFKLGTLIIGLAWFFLAALCLTVAAEVIIKIHV